MMKKLGTVIALAALHMAVSKAVVAVAMQIDLYSVEAGWAAIAVGRTLIALTRVLYFPILTLSLYSRQWFPGDWIVIPLAANSLLWGTAVAVILWWWRRRSKSR